MATYQNAVLPESTTLEKVFLLKPDSLRTFVAACLKKAVIEPEVVAYCSPNVLTEARLIVWYLGTDQFRMYRASDLFSLAVHPDRDACRDVLERAAIIYVQDFVEKKKPLVSAILVLTPARNAFFPVQYPRDWDQDAVELADRLPPPIVEDILAGTFYVAPPQDTFLTKSTPNGEKYPRISILRGARKLVAHPGIDHYRISGAIYDINASNAFVVEVSSYDNPVKM